MDSLSQFKAKLDLLDTMLRSIKTTHERVTQLRRSVFVLKKLLKDENTYQSPYGPTAGMARFSLQ
jgi:hypothetical protein